MVMLDGKDIIPVKLYDDRKENYIEINYTFDKVYRSWLKKLLDFVKKWLRNVINILKKC